VYIYLLPIFLEKPFALIVTMASLEIESQLEKARLQDGPKYERTPFGKEMLKHFLMDPSYKNLNHGISS
jgi:hypothetical protein